MKPEEKDLVAKNDAQEHPKKPYATPKLTIHGNVEKITEECEDGGSDGYMGSCTMVVP